MRRLAGTVTVLLCMLVGGVRSARADSVGYTLVISGSVNGPTFQFTNDSISASIIETKITIGDIAYNFDSSVGEISSSAITFVQLGPDNANGGGRDDHVTYTGMSNFVPGAQFQFTTDIDKDVNDPPNLDYRTILFDLGGSDRSDNSTISVKFSTGGTLSGQLPDYAVGSTPNDLGPFAFGQSNALVNAVPLPGVALGAVALLGMVAVRKRLRGQADGCPLSVRWAGAVRKNRAAGV